MLSPDILQGLKMDINRPFGNGVDDNGDVYAAIDEYDLFGVSETASQQIPYPVPITSTEADIGKTALVYPTTCYWCGINSLNIYTFCSDLVARGWGL